MKAPRNYNKWDAIIDFAIAQEQKSAESYETLAAKVKDDEQIGLFNRLALMERGHMSKLQSFKEGAMKFLGGREVEDIASDLLEDDKIKEDFAEPAEILELAIQNEIKSHQLYKTLKQNYLPTEDQELFEKLAREELNHIDILKNMLKRYQD